MKLNSLSFAILVASAQQTGADCLPPYVPDPLAVGSSDYVSARQSCTDACNVAGYCCTLGYGGCNNVPCTTGCHIAFFSTDLGACYDECDIANDGNVNYCAYTHDRHPDVGHLGFNPEWLSSSGVYATKKCGGSTRCGCPTSDSWGTANDCSSGACKAGCDMAYEQTRRDMFFRGEAVPYDPRIGLDRDALLEAMENLTGHVDGTSPLSEENIDGAREAIAANSPLLPANFTLMSAVLDLIDNYESTNGALFIGDQSRGGFKRDPSSTDGKQLERAMLAVQQAALDEIYHGTIKNFHDFDRLHSSIVEPCATYLDGHKWLTSKYFPGDIVGDPPAGYESEIHLIDINATMPECWGRPVAFCTELSIRPTGLYLEPGRVAIVTLPSIVLATPGFKLQVGANIIDNSNKGTHKRMDRITTTFDIKQTVTYVANPLGGGLYLRIPYLADLGMITVNITGGVVKAPMFKRTRSDATTEQEWSVLQTAHGPWADLETDNLHLTVPRMWMYDYDYNHFETLATDWSRAMDGVSELFGFPPDLRNNYVLYLMPDLYIRHGSYGIGYPQVNDVVGADENGPKLSGHGSSPGRATYWLVTNPINPSGAAFHELGHAQLFTKYRGETEAAVNVPLVYVQNVKFGYPLDQAFTNSFSGVGLFTIDGAAVDWMVKENFRLGNEMDITNSEYNEMRYQHRGYAKYADIARIYGWSVLSDFFHQEHLDYNSGVSEGHSETDDRTLHLSIAAGEDLTPLIHFWGIHPVDRDSLKAEMEQRGLYPSEALRDHIARYATIVPMDQAAFIDHFEEAWPGKKDCGCCPSPLYGCGWYNANYPLWDESLAQATANAVHAILDQYYTANPTAAPSSAPTLCVDIKSASWCSKPNRCPNDNCRKTCGTCGNAGPPPSPTTSPTIATTCLAKNSPCQDISPDPCCGSCNLHNGKCSNSGRLLRHRMHSAHLFRLLRSAKGRASIVFDDKGNPPGFDRAAASSKLNIARGRWRAQTPENYCFEYERDFTWPEEERGPFLVCVRSGTVASVVYKDGGGPVETHIAFDIPTMEDLFDNISKEGSKDIVNLDVEFDKMIGVPKKLLVAYLPIGEGNKEVMNIYYIRNVSEVA